MILTQPQAMACVYALDTSDLCVHLTIGADIDVQKLPSGCVTVEGLHGSEHYSDVDDFAQAYKVTPFVPGRPLQFFEEHIAAKAAAQRIDRIGRCVIIGVGICMVMAAAWAWLSN